MNWDRSVIWGLLENELIWVTRQNHLLSIITAVFRGLHYLASSSFQEFVRLNMAWFSMILDTRYRIIWLQYMLICGHWTSENLIRKFKKNKTFYWKIFWTVKKLFIVSSKWFGGRSKKRIHDYRYMHDRLWLIKIILYMIILQSFWTEKTVQRLKNLSSIRHQLLHYDLYSLKNQQQTLKDIPQKSCPKEIRKTHKKSRALVFSLEKLHVSNFFSA